MHSGGNEQIHLNNIGGNDKAHAFKILFERYSPKIFNYALRLCKSQELAEDIVHDVFLSIWMHKSPFEIKNLESYLKISARNQLLKTFKKQHDEYRFQADMKVEWNETYNGTEELISFKETETMVYEAIELLPPQQKIVFQLCQIQGLKYKEAADKLSLSPLTVKTHMQHALRFLRTHLKSKNAIALYLLLIQIVKEI